MNFSVNDSVGEGYSDSLLFAARDKTLAMIHAAAAQIKPGMTEKQARGLVRDLEAAAHCPTPWHGPQIRFGKNTLLTFGATGDSSVILNENDIFFFDLGPVFESHEGDVGRTFCVGHDPEMKKICKDIETVWLQVRNYWAEQKVSGEKLYEYAAQAAQDLGWALELKGASGHRVADFPHMAKRRGVIRRMQEVPVTNRWILEIQLRHPEREFGAFFEDILQ